MQPFLSFYGGKYNMAQRLRQPRFPLVIEPFAGGAGYSCYWQPKDVILIERDQVVAGVWRYLIKVKESEFLRLPIVTDVEELPHWVCQEAAWLIGFRMNRGIQVPGKKLSNWGRQAAAGNRISNNGIELKHVTPSSAPPPVADPDAFWSVALRDQLAWQLKLIRHWKIIEGDWFDAPDVEAHWHIDPPYNNQAGRAYKHNKVDFDALAAWCKTRKGHVQVCENDGAEWLPFKQFAVTKGTAGRNRKGWSAEAVFELGAPGQAPDFFIGVKHDDRSGIQRAAGNQARQGPAEVPAANSRQGRSPVQKGRRELAASFHRSPEVVQRSRRSRGKG